MQEEEENEVDRDAVGNHGLKAREFPEGTNDGLGSCLDNSVHQLQKLSPLPPPSPPVSSIIWERFLPVKSLRVLLVENDDSTRQVVTALLRNCSYEVVAVSNGLEAWKTLLELSYHVDLILTEVVMPALSGIGLLEKIMSHKTLKNIPLIMMSSHDSMGIVFKCLSKGAVDFLVKPIRKNELKNLWQHVWRRCHSSSGSGSESGVQTQKSVKSKSVESEDNGRCSDEDDDDVSLDYNDKDGSDNGSGTQSSWTKHAPESPRPSFPGDQHAEAPDSTCAQFIHQRPYTTSKDYFHSCSDCSKPRSQHDEEKIENDSEGKLHHTDSAIKALEDSNPVDKSANIAGTMSVQASNCLHRFMEEKDKIVHDNSRSFDLSLKRLRSIGGDGIGCSDDRCVLQRSDFSAFSRYNTSTCPRPSSAAHPLPRGKINKAGVTTEQPSDIHHEPSDHDQTVKSMAAAAPPCASSNMVTGPTEVNLGNYSVNASVSGSHHGSNAPNGSTMNLERTNVESENGLTGKTEGAGCSGSGSGSGVDESRFAQRVAALTKFRQKRKQRCFQKKVRYQSRKKLAEQRPRVRGQFVKQMARDHMDLEGDD